MKDWRKHNVLYKPKRSFMVGGGVGGGRQGVSNVAMHTIIVSPPLGDSAQRVLLINGAFSTTDSS